MNATKLADNCLADVRHQVNVTLWMVVVRRRLAEETNAAKRTFLAEMLVELNKRLPEREPCTA